MILEIKTYPEHLAGAPRVAVALRRLGVVTALLSVAAQAAEDRSPLSASNNDQWALIANTFPGPDIGAKINAAISALPNTGGRIIVKPGVYDDVKTTVALTKSVKLECSTPSSCDITWAAGYAGIVCEPSARHSIVEGFSLGSAATTAEPHNGLTFECQGFTGRNLILKNWGQDGVAGLSSPVVAANANMWRLDNVLALHVRRDGFHMDGSDTNVGVCTDCHVFGYARYGMFDNSISNTYIQPSVSPAGLQPGEFAYRIVGSSNTLISPYCEGEAEAIVQGVSARIYSVIFGQCAWSNPGGVTNKIDLAWQGLLATNSLALSPQPGTISPALYHWRNGIAGPARLDLIDETHRKQIWEYDPAAGTLYQHQPFRALYVLPEGDRSTLLATTAWASDAANLTQGTISAARMPTVPLNGTSAPKVSACGGGARLAEHSSNGGGQFTTGAGSPASCTINFALAWPNAAFCTISPANNAAANLSSFVSMSSSGGFSVTMSRGVSSAAFNYTCQGK
jgi:hypothetical protein